ncbi:MAG: Swt1 family HEPN domain-containing protein, partial [Acidobacteriota bacterium]
MATSNRERIGKALEVLNAGLQPFIEREMQAALGDRWEEEARSATGDERKPSRKSKTWDTHALLSVMWNQWNAVFGRKLSQAERSIVSELRDVRNRWAHQEAFNIDDTYRALDSMQRLLVAISAPEAAEIDKQKHEVLRIRFEEQARRETKKAAVAPIEGQPAGGLLPWREIVTPHPDVASGRYQQAEFAADLGQVHRGEGSDEYRDPRSFFQRTFLTEGLKHLLTGSLRRLSNTGGDPVIELQTNFGGGKTHSMLALYHLFSGVAVSELAGIESVLEQAGVTELPKVRRAVLVGTALSPAQPLRKSKKQIINTLWGEMAWQLLGDEGYALVAEADRQGVSPGSDALRELFQRAAPCLVLIDEWIAYVRQLYGVSGLAGGSFDASLTFAQALTEAARAVAGALVVASIPSSDIEIGGEGGHEALTRLRNTFGRLESAWRPASAEEGFEIVRRRLFQPITESQKFTTRDAVVKAFMDVYHQQSGEFPSECREADYERRMKAAFPIHPELFDRLYNDWSSLDKFQRTRGVLRLMAAVIHALWEREDRSLLIMPASTPVDDPAVQFELTRYLEDPWIPVIEKDVDGPHSLSLRLDRENPNLGRYSACRRVARTLYLGSAPTLHTANKGLDDRRIKLGCAQPGESVPTFGDALRRLTDQATHLYVDGSRYWYSTQPSVNRLAQDRASQQSDDAVHEEILSRLRTEAKQRGDFVGVHLVPGAEVPDERDARLVFMGPSYSHSSKSAESPARQEAARLLEMRGSGPRSYKNALVFLAPDSARLRDLEQAVRQYLAWKSIDEEHETLNLDAFQENQAKTKHNQADDIVRQRIPETYIWLLAPGLPSPSSPISDIEWHELRLQGQDALALRASKKLRNEELMITQLAGTRLRLELDRVPLWRGDHVSVKQLAEDFAKYLYLPRLRDTNVLLNAIQEGASLLTWEQETFATAEGY